MAVRVQCVEPFCGRRALAGRLRCEEHQPALDKAAAARLGKRHRMYNSVRWRRASRAYRVDHPSCVVCGHPAECVDHVEPHGGDWERFWDVANWQALCHSCHSIKTRAETAR